MANPDDWRKALGGDDPNQPPPGAPPPGAPPAPGGTQTPGIIGQALNPGASPTTPTTGGGSPFEALAQPGVMPGGGAPSPGGTATPGVMPQQPDLAGSPGQPVQPPPAGSPGAPTTPGQPQTPGQPAAAPDQQGVQQFQSWAQNMFGRQASPQELQQIAQRIGYTGGTLTPEMMQQAQTVAQEMARGMGWNPQPGQPGGPEETGTGADSNTLLEQRIREMLSQNPNDIDPNNPAAAAQRNAFRGANQRALERAKRNAAERAAGSGTTGAGGFEASLQGMDLAGAQAEGEFEGQLMQRELQTQRDQTMQAMQMAQQAGLTREAQRLQERLAQQDLTLRRMLGMGQLGLGAASLNQQGRQFDARLGFDYWNQLQNAERGELMNFLGGL